MHAKRCIKFDEQIQKNTKTLHKYKLRIKSREKKIIAECVVDATGIFEDMDMEFRHTSYVQINWR